MFNKVQFITGLLSGLLFPVIITIAYKLLPLNRYTFDKPYLPYLVSIALNLFVLRYFIKTGKDDAVKGIMLTTFVFIVAVFMFKLKL